MNKSAASFVDDDSGQLKAKKILALADYFRINGFKQFHTKVIHSLVRSCATYVIQFTSLTLSTRCRCMQPQYL